MNLSKCVKFANVLAAVGLGTATESSSLIDMQGFEGVIGILGVGAITDGTPSIKAQGGNLADGSDLADLAGTNTVVLAADSGDIAVLDVYRPEFRYLKFVAVRGGATGSILDGITALQYGARFLPTAQASTVAATNLVISPAVGVA